MGDNFCEYKHEDCEYLTICKDIIENQVCIRDLLGEELIAKPEYSPEAIMKRIKYFGHRHK